MAEAKTDTAVKAKKASTTPKKAPAAKAEKPAVAAKPAAAKKTTTARSSKDKIDVSPEQRYIMICEAAYYKAERRGFSPENEIQDWLDAEAEINRMLGM